MKIEDGLTVHFVVAVVIGFVIGINFIRMNKSQLMNHNFVASLYKFHLLGKLICKQLIIKEHATTPDYGLGTVGKCLGPTTSKGPTKDGCKIC